MLRYVLINKPTGHHPGAPLEGFPQEASCGLSATDRDRSLVTIGARLLLWETPSFMPEANPRQKASFKATPILTSLFRAAPPCEDHSTHDPACTVRECPHGPLFFDRRRFMVNVRSRNPNPPGSRPVLFFRPHRHKTLIPDLCRQGDG